MAYDDQTSCSKGGFDALAQKSDSVDLTTPCRCLYADAAVKVTTIDGSVLTFTNFAGGILPVQVRRLWSTGTSATVAIGLY